MTENFSSKKKNWVSHVWGLVEKMQKGFYYFTTNTQRNLLDDARSNTTQKQRIVSIIFFLLLGKKENNTHTQVHAQEKRKKKSNGKKKKKKKKKSFQHKIHDLTIILRIHHNTNSLVVVQLYFGCPFLLKFCFNNKFNIFFYFSVSISISVSLFHIFFFTSCVLIDSSFTTYTITDYQSYSSINNISLILPSKRSHIYLFFLFSAIFFFEYRNTGKRRDRSIFSFFFSFFTQHHHHHQLLSTLTIDNRQSTQTYTHIHIETHYCFIQSFIKISISVFRLSFSLFFHT